MVACLKVAIPSLAFFVVGAACLRARRCKQNSRDVFFQRLLELPANLREKAFMTRTLHHFLWFQLWILLMNLQKNDKDSWGLEIWCPRFFFKFGVLKFNLGSWNVVACLKVAIPSLAFFVVGAACLRPRRCKQNSRGFFSAPFGASCKFARKSVYDPNFASFFVISTLIFCSLCWWICKKKTWQW